VPGEVEGGACEGSERNAGYIYRIAQNICSRPYLSVVGVYNWL